MNLFKISSIFIFLALWLLPFEITKEYYGILSIPKIKLEQEFYPFSSIDNDVDKNIEVLNPSCFIEDSCNFVLASHSGTSSVSYFQYLDTLNINDIAEIYHKNKIYSYSLKEIMYVSKSSSIEIPKTNTSTLVLTTCHKRKDDIQNIYIFDLFKKEEI